MREDPFVANPSRAHTTGSQLQRGLLSQEPKEVSWIAKIVCLPIPFHEYFAVVGTVLREKLKDDFTLIGIDDDVTENLEGCYETRSANLQDAKEVNGLFDDVDAVIHLAAEPSAYSAWETVYSQNIKIDGHVMIEAAKAGVSR